MKGCHFVKKSPSTSPGCSHGNGSDCFVKVDNEQNADAVVCDPNVVKPLNKSANSWFWFSFSIIVILAIFLAFFFFSIFFIGRRKK